MANPGTCMGLTLSMWREEEKNSRDGVMLGSAIRLLWGAQMLLGVLLTALFCALGNMEAPFHEGV